MVNNSVIIYLERVKKKFLVIETEYENSEITKKKEIRTIEIEKDIIENKLKNKEYNRME